MKIEFQRLVRKWITASIRTRRITQRHFLAMELAGKPARVYPTIYAWHVAYVESVKGGKDAHNGVQERCTIHLKLWRAGIAIDLLPNAKGDSREE